MLMIALCLSLYGQASGESHEGPSPESIVREMPSEDSGQRLRKTTADLCDMMFGMEKGGCAAAAAQGNQGNQGNRGTASKQEAPASGGAVGGGGGAGSQQQDVGKMGLAPWQDGVMERLAKELSPQEFNMYLVHHGRMLLTFGQIQACTPRERDFVYGSLEPITLQTVRTFKARLGNGLLL